MGAAANAPKPKRQRFERYDDDFIDDSEIERAKGGPLVKTKYKGFYVNAVRTLAVWTCVMASTAGRSLGCGCCQGGCCPHPRNGPDSMP